jgi:hypothetical protein
MTEVTTVPLADATLAQLRAFALTHLQLDVPKTANRDMLIGKISQAWDKPEIPVAAETLEAKPEGKAPRPANKKQADPTDTDSKKDPMIRIYINISETKGGSDPIPVGVNGRVMLVPRGKEIDVPSRYVHALKNAKTLVYGNDEKGRFDPTPREVPAYPFQVISQRDAA